MILHYFKKKENNLEKLSQNTYNSILLKSKLVINNQKLSINKNYNSSFEIVSIFLIMHIKLNIEYKIKDYKIINEHLVSILISDLDESLRTKGIGDMSIGKYVKKYVKKFYFRLNNFPTNIDLKNLDLFVNYLKMFDFIEPSNYSIGSKVLLNYYIEILKDFNKKN